MLWMDNSAVGRLAKEAIGDVMVIVVGKKRKIKSAELFDSGSRDRPRG